MNFFPLKNFFLKKRIYSTFTYYIPAPPNRKTGYQEQEFDKLVFEAFQDKDLEIMSINTIANHKDGGFWAIILIKSSKQLDNFISKDIPLPNYEDKNGKIEIDLGDA